MQPPTTLEMNGPLHQLTLLLRSLMALVMLACALSICLIAICWNESSFAILPKPAASTIPSLPEKNVVNSWRAPDTSSIPHNTDGQLIRYGRELIANTSKYFGPQGSIAPTTNGMNCQNCHLDAGTKPWGNNYAAVYASYPKFRARSGTNESIVKRISDCFERSLNGTKPDSNSREMAAIVAYMKWLGKGIPKGEKPAGSGLKKLAYLDRAADPGKGEPLYRSKCAACHGTHGEGLQVASADAYTYPPLWGKHSYNNAAGLYRISNFASFIKSNMPLGVTAENPVLSDEEAWDIAAFVNSQPRPERDQSADWKDISQKPVDFPIGPFTDSFSEKQHKYGPYIPMTIKQ